MATLSINVRYTNVPVRNTEDWGEETADRSDNLRRYYVTSVNYLLTNRRIIAFTYTETKKLINFCQYTVKWFGNS